MTADEIRRIAHRAIEVFEELGDEEGLSKAQHFLSVSAVERGRATEALPDAELSLEHALRSGARILLEEATDAIDLPMQVGPTPAGAALDRLERLADQMAGYRSAEAAAAGRVAECLAFLGRFEEARAAARHAMATFEELDSRWGIAVTGWILSQIEFFAGNPFAAEEGYRAWCGFHRDLGTGLVLVDAVLELAELLVVQGRDDEVLEQTNGILSLIGPNDAWTQSRWREVRSVPLARLGHLDDAMTLIEEAERWAKGTDLFVLIAATMRSKAEVLKIANRREEAVVAAREALALYETKEFIPHIGWTQELLDSLTL